MSAVETGGCAPPVQVSDATPGVLAVLARYEREREIELRRLQVDVSLGRVEEYEKELADLTAWHRDAVETHATVAELMAAATALANEHDALHGECACGGDPGCAACRVRAALTRAEPKP